MLSFAVFKIAFILLLIEGGTAVRRLDLCSSVAYSNICVQLGEKFYLIDGNAEMNWYDAERFCRRQNGFLANIENQNEMTAISNYLVSRNYLANAHWFWISGNDLGTEGTFHSIETGDIFPYTNWTPGQPDNAGGNENCVHLWKYRGGFGMNDAGCNAKIHFICEINPSNGNILVDQTHTDIKISFKRE